MRRWARIFDSAFRIPGTQITFGIDPILGLFPGIGDLFDFAWKANAWNLALLEKHAMAGQRASSADWLFVIICCAIVVLVALIPILLLWLGLSWLELHFH